MDTQNQYFSEQTTDIILKAFGLKVNEEGQIIKQHTDEPLVDSEKGEIQASKEDSSYKILKEDFSTLMNLTEKTN